MFNFKNHLNNSSYLFNNSFMVASSGGSWWLPSTWAADFGTVTRMYDGTTQYNTLAAMIAAGKATLTRSSSKLAINAAGVYSSFVANTLAVTDLGASIEPASTNYNNNTNVGAVVGVIGSGGALPTGWTQQGSLNGLTISVASVGTENGLQYIDIRWQGTPTASSNAGLYFSGSTSVPALQNEVWTNSFYAHMTSGSLTNISTVLMNFVERTSGGSGSGGSGSAPITLKSSFTRFSLVRTLTAPSTAFVHNGFSLSYTSGQAIDITIRFSLPQLEKQPKATSPILTGTTAVTRAADALVLKPIAGTYNITHTFDDNSTQVLNSQVVGVGGYAVPTNLNRQFINRIAGV